MEESNAHVSPEVNTAVHEDLEQSLATVREMEADAEKKGIPLNLSGARYRIYETTQPT